MNLPDVAAALWPGAGEETTSCSTSLLVSALRLIVGVIALPLYNLPSIMQLTDRAIGGDW